MPIIQYASRTCLSKWQEKSNCRICNSSWSFPCMECLDNLLRDKEHCKDANTRLLVPDKVGSTVLVHNLQSDDILWCNCVFRKKEAGRMAAHRIYLQCDKRRFSLIRVFRGSIFPSMQCMADNALRCDNYGQPKIRKIVRIYPSSVVTLCFS